MRSNVRLLGGAALALALLLSGGCRRDGGTAGKTADGGGSKKTPGGHVHPHEGPHGGALAEWGAEEFHAEFIVDHDKKEATVYVLDEEVKKPVPIDAPTVTLTLTNVKPKVQIELKPDPQEGDPKGKASRFRGSHETLGTVMEFRGEISATFGGTPYTGTFREEPHKHEHKKK